MTQNFEKTNDITISLKNIISEELSDMSHYLDLEKIQNHLIQGVITTQTIHKINCQNERNDTLNNTLSNYNYQFSSEQKEIFKELIQYDLAYTIDNKQVFYKLNILLSNIFLHLETLEKLYSLEEKEIHEKGIVKTSHPIVRDAITPRQNHIEESINYNPTESNKLQQKIYNEFNENPLEIDAMYFAINQFGKDVFRNIDEDVLDTLFKKSVYLNSAGL